MMRPHQLQDERSLAIHQFIAQQLQEGRLYLDRPRARVAEWLATGSTHRHYATAWDELLSGPLGRLLETLVDPGERATALRHVSPFAGLVDVKTREKIWREVRDRFDAEERQVKALG